MRRFWLACVITALATSQAIAGPPNYEMSEAYSAGSDAFRRNDLTTATPLIRKAAEAGDSGAQMMLGGLYQWGQGVPKDYREAHKWLSLASDQGWGEAMNNLGMMYRRGTGVPTDYVSALKWLLLAQERVSEPHDMVQMLADNIITLKAVMTNKQIGKAKRKAASWKQAHVGR